MSELTDNDLMLRVKTGDLDKMKLLYSRHYRSLYKFLYHMTHNKEASEDMVQNVFYRILKYRHTYTGKGEFVTWAFHLSRNVLKDHLKRQKRLKKYDDVDAISELISGDLLADEQLKNKQEQFHLFKMMEKLSDEEREILTLSKFQELKYQEIAQILDITEGAVKVRVHRAFAHLKDIYLKKGYYEL